MLNSQKKHKKFETTPNICVETDSPRCIWSELLGWLCFNYNDETVLQGETQYKYAEWQEQ